MKPTLAIIDCDRHVMEPLALWQHYLPSDIYQQMPLYLTYDSDEARSERAARLGSYGDIALPPQAMLGDYPILQNWSEQTQVASAHINQDSQKQRNDASTPQSQLASMDETDIGQALLFPTFAAYAVNHAKAPATVSLAYATAYNHWLKDYIAVNPERLLGVGLISRHEPNTLRAQVEQIAALGFKAVTIRPEVICGRSLGDADYDDFWQACEQYNLTVVFHGGTHLEAASVGSDRFTTRFALHACAHPMEIQLAFVSLLDGGVLERHPALRLAFLEAGSAWIPHWLWRLDNICYPEFPSLVKDHITMLPSAYFKKHCWVTLEIGEPCLDAVVAMIGHEKLLYGSDFPHPDHLHFDVAQIAASCPELSEQQLSDILTVNPKHCFGLTD